MRYIFFIHEKNVKRDKLQKAKITVNTQCSSSGVILYIYKIVEISVRLQLDFSETALKRARGRDRGEEKRDKE